MKRRFSGLGLLLGALALLPAAAIAQDDFNEAKPFLDGRPFYVSPVVSYGLADKHRGTKDGIGGSVSVGKKVTSGLALEFIGAYMQMEADPNEIPGSSGDFKLWGAGIAATIFPVKRLPDAYLRLNLMHATGQDAPGVITNYDSTVFDVGLGYMLPITSRIALRAEALYRLDHHNRRSAGVQPLPDGRNNRQFYDGVFSLGLVVPLGSKPKPIDPDTIDSDGDGVPDHIDQCPNTPAGIVVDATGCPLDSDNDGVPDHLDQCPDTPAGVQVDATGCPVDSDGDGIPDHLDECPNSPAGAKVMEDGCALAGDCRRPKPGEQVDEKGCAVERGFILHGVTFEFDSDRLTPEAEQILNKVAETLIAYPEIDVEVEGHTDFVGTDGYNLGLSERRAIAVKAYLSSRGVEAARMTPVGYGRSRPIADNSTEEGRDQNRRVELRPSNM